MTTNRNRFEPVSSALLLAAGVIASIVVISLIMYGVRSARGYADAVMNSIEESTMYLSQSGLTEYEGMTVSGADVINYCKRYGDGDVRIELEYGDGNTGSVFIYGESVALTDMRSGSGTLRIRPGEDWLCSVSRNANKVVTAVRYARK